MDKTSTADPATAAVPRQAGPDATAESDLLRRLRAGDEQAFVGIVEKWSRTMLRVARGFVSTDASAQEVVQDTWLAVVRGLSSFEERSSLRTWTFRILVNTAKTRGVRDSRTIPLSSVTLDDAGGPTVDPSRFRAADDEWPGNWTPAGMPVRWDADPEAGALRKEVQQLVEAALVDLPDRQRTVVVLRDVEGCDSDEVCAILGVSAENQRVLLHRGRAKVRAALEDYYREHAR